VIKEVFVNLAGWELLAEHEGYQRYEWLMT
jgi:hypothetical protein